MAQVKPTHNAGLGEKYIDESKRLINKDGSFNLKRNGAHPWQARSLYQWFVGLSWPAFLSVIVLLYLLTNVFFACIYLLLGVDSLRGTEPGMPMFWSAFFFSAQTFTTVGYGAILPTGLAANFVASLEAFMGWSGFALVTGLLYGRFSRPSTRFLFSTKALVSPYQDVKSLQFRMVNMRNNIMMEMEAHVMLMVLDKDSGHRRYYNLKLETRFIYFFPLNWTIVHVIDEESPLYNYDADKLKQLDAEILIHIKGYDDTFGQTVHLRYSYKYDEIVHGARFLKVYQSDENGNTHLDLNKIHDYELIN